MIQMHFYIWPKKQVDVNSFSINKFCERGLHVLSAGNEYSPVNPIAFEYDAATW